MCQTLHFIIATALKQVLFSSFCTRDTELQEDLIVWKCRDSSHDRGSQKTMLLTTKCYCLSSARPGRDHFCTFLTSGQLWLMDELWLSSQVFTGFLRWERGGTGTGWTRFWLCPEGVHFSGDEKWARRRQREGFFEKIMSKFQVVACEKGLVLPANPIYLQGLLVFTCLTPSPNTLIPKYWWRVLCEMGILERVLSSRI